MGENGDGGKEVAPLASVCIPTHDRAHLLNDVLASIGDQETGPGIELELIVVDDGSVDDTASVVAAFAKLWPRVRYVQTPALGPGAARNTAAGVASGKWLAFFDDDQVASKSWISELLRVATSEDAHCVGGPVLLRLPEGVNSNHSDRAMASRREPADDSIRILASVVGPPAEIGHPGRR